MSPTELTKATYRIELSLKRAFGASNLREILSLSPSLNASEFFDGQIKVSSSTNLVEIDISTLGIDKCAVLFVATTQHIEIVLTGTTAATTSSDRVSISKDGFLFLSATEFNRLWIYNNSGSESIVKIMALGESS